MLWNAYTRDLGFEFWLCSSVTLLPWTSHLAFLSFIFLMCKSKNTQKNVVSIKRYTLHTGMLNTQYLLFFILGPFTPFSQISVPPKSPIGYIPKILLERY